MATGTIIGMNEILKITKTLDTPRGVRLEKVDVGDDHSGDPALWIFFAVDKKIKLTHQRVIELRKFADAVSDKVQEANLGPWPYVRFVEAR
ncbi:MAG: hypothetical protein ACYCSN_03275 [Acidobacteriaceae bacterium]